MKNVIVLLLATHICMKLDFGSGYGAVASDVFDKRSSDEDANFELASKRQQHTGESSPHLLTKRQSLSNEHRSSNRLTARRVRDKLVQRDRLRAERESFLQGFLALRAAQLGTSDTDLNEKRSMTSQLERSPTVSKKRADALHSIRALEERAADRLPEERAVDESDRLVARGARLRAVEALVARVRSLFAVQERSAETVKDDDEDLLDERASAVASSSSSNSSGSSTNSSSSSSSSNVDMSQYEMHGTFVYEANYNMSAIWCRTTCDNEQVMCASFLFIEENGICVFHHDIE